MAQYPELFVLRHGQTEWNVSGRYQGRMDSALTKLGVEQANIQGQILKQLSGVDSIQCFSSPLLRASRTAEIALAAIGQVAMPDPRLQEIDFGDWEGKTRHEVQVLLPPEMRDGQNLGWYFKSPRGERFADISKRVRHFLDELQAPAIVVTHGVTSMVLRGLWLGYSETELLGLPHKQGCVYHLQNGGEDCLET